MDNILLLMLNNQELPAHDRRYSELRGDQLYIKPSALHGARELITMHAHGGLSLTDLVISLADEYGVVLSDKNDKGQYMIHARSWDSERAQPVLQTVASLRVESL